MGGHPATQAAALYWQKARGLLDFMEQSNNQNIYFFRNYNGFINWPIFVSFWLLLPLAVAGLIVNRRDRNWALFAGFVVIYLASFLPFFVSARYRVPVIPFLILIAAVFIADRLKDFRFRQWKRLGTTVGLALSKETLVMADALLPFSAASRATLAGILMARSPPPSGVISTV